MNVGFQKLTDGFVNEPMARERREATERGGDDSHLVMTMATGRAAVPNVPVAIIQNLELGGREGRLQTSA